MSANAEQLLHLARIRGPFTPDKPEHAELVAYSDHITQHTSDVRDTLARYDEDAAATLITDIEALTDALNTAIDEQLAADRARPTGAAHALAYHYLTRIATHPSNVLTSIAMPLDKLDHYDRVR